MFLSILGQNGTKTKTRSEAVLEADRPTRTSTGNDKMLEKGFRMDRGYGKLRGKAFRIAHMGNVFRADLEEYLNNFDEVLNG